MGTNTALNADSAVTRRSGLQPVHAGGWLGGFGNMLNKEIGEWFGMPRWIIQLAIWTAIVNGMLAFVIYVVPSLPRSENAGVMPNLDPAVFGLSAFFSVLVQAGAIGAIISAQDAIIGEKQTGTAAWVLSKPVSRQSFVLSKLLGIAIGLLVFAVTIPALIAYGELAFALGYGIEVLPYVVGVVVSSLGILFFVALTMMLGTFFNHRGPVIGITLGLVFGGAILISLVPEVAAVLPVKIDLVAFKVATGEVLTPENWATIGTALAGIVAFSLVALWRFDKQEF
jgi:ABC-2 type transport system permease protein